MFVLTFVHVVAGTAAFLAGVTALVSRKGHRWHRRAGRVFCLSLVTTAVAGSLMAIVQQQLITALAGILAAYLVLTGWQSVSGGNPRGRVAPMFATGSVIVVTIALLTLGFLALNATDRLYQAFGAGDYFFLAAIAALAGGGDMVWFASGGYTGKRRIARHLWRLCTGMFFATGSIFTGPGAGVFPEALRTSSLLALPESLVLVTMIYWLVRVRKSVGGQLVRG